MFQDHYVGWRNARISTTLHLVGPDFFKGRSILELGAGFAEIGDFFQSNFDCQVTSSEGRLEHVEIIRTKIMNGEYSPKLLVRHDNMEHVFNTDTKYDIIIHWGLLYHLSDVELHLKDILQHTDYIFLETEVCDSLEDVCLKVTECGYDQAISNTGSRPSPRYVERILDENGFNFELIKSNTLNSSIHIYDWDHDPHRRVLFHHGLRRFWVCWRKTCNNPLRDQNSVV